MSVPCFLNSSAFFPGNVVGVFTGKQFAEQHLEDTHPTTTSLLEAAKGKGSENTSPATLGTAPH